MTRVAIIGDVGGHRRCLTKALGRAGCDATSHTLPDDLTIIQVGDLVGGPDDDAVVADVREWQGRYPDRWIQLIGNHEAQHLGGTPFVSKHRAASTSPDTVRRLQAMTRVGRMHAAVCVRTARGDDIVVTHAGISSDYWRRELGSDTDASRVAARLNRMVSCAPLVLYRPGVMLHGYENRTEVCAGPVWALAGPEVYDSWVGEPLPFGQTHGHTTPYWYSGRRWTPEASAYIRKHAVVNKELRRLWIDIGGRRIVAVDSGLGSKPTANDLHPFMLDAEVLIPTGTDQSAQPGDHLPTWARKWDRLG